MYNPQAFKVQDSKKLTRFMDQNSFATVVTYADGAPFASHLPIMFDGSCPPSGRLLGHMARENPQWRHFIQGTEALVIFHGPHAYISPRWYKSDVAVPTWNYAVVHAYGTPRVIEDVEFLEAVLAQTVDRFEGQSPEAWRGNLPGAMKGRMIKAIVGFEILINRMEGKFKLGQNRSESDLLGVHKALSESVCPEDRKLAALMRDEGLVH